MPSSEPPRPARGKCPICGRPTDAGLRPFCSRRCADVDLSRWMSCAYAIPDEAESEDGDEGKAAAGGSDGDGEGSNGKG
jgi:uncharacterized protein